MSIYKAILGAGIALAVVAAIPSYSQAKDCPDDPVRITHIIWTESSNAAWAPMIRGVEEAAEYTCADVDIQYGDADPEKQNSIMQAAIANEVDAVTGSLFVSDAFIDSIRQMTEAGILFINNNINDPVANAEAMHPTFVGQDLEEAGYLMGKALIKEYGMKNGDHLFMPVEYPEAAYAQLRHDGVLRAVEEAGLDVTTERLGTTASFENALPVVTQYLIGHPETDFIISLGGTPGGIAAQAIEEAGLENIPNGTFDINTRVLRAIKEGTTYGTVDQQFYIQGFMPVLWAHLWKQYGIQPSTYYAGNAIVIQSNVHYAEDWSGEYR